MEIIQDKLDQILNEGALEFRGDGRAGSGIVLTMQSIAAIAVTDPTLHVQEWPFFSAARKGAPTRGFLRLSRKPIEKSSDVQHPHISIMMDEGVTRMVDFAEGVRPGGIFVLNTPMSPKAAAKKFKLSGRVFTIDGDNLALQYLKNPLGNISVLAVLMNILPGFEPEQAVRKLRDLLKKRRLPESLIQANGNLFQASLGKAHQADCNEAGSSDHQTSPFQGYGELMPGAQSRLRLSRTNLTSAYARTGFVLHFEDPKKDCNGCGHCIINCPENIIRFEPDPEIGVRVLGADISSYCKLCRECIEVCPKNLFKEVPHHEVMKEAST